MFKMRQIMLFGTLLLLNLIASKLSAQNAKRDEALESMKRATRYMMEEVAFKGAFVWNYLPDFSRSWGELEARRTMVWIQPPGTPSMGHLLLDAYHATGDEYYYESAQKVASALQKAQLNCGGWNYVYDLDGEDSLKLWYKTVGENAWRLEEFQHYYGNATFDDAGTIHSAKFFLRLYAEKKDTSYRNTLNKVIQFVMESQYACGGWPQRFPLRYEHSKNGWPDYSPFITLNDDVMMENIEFLTLCFQFFGNIEYKNRVIKAMHCLKNLQQGKPYSGWADQYTTDLKPAHARTYEPRAINSSTSMNCIYALMDFYEATGDTSFLSGIPSAIEFIESQALPDSEIVRSGKQLREPGSIMVPRFVDPDSGKPLYIHRKGSNVKNGMYFCDQDISNTIGHYSSQAILNTSNAKQRYNKLLENLKNNTFEANNTFEKNPLPRFFTRDYSDFMPATNVERVLEHLDNKGRWLSQLRSISNVYVENNTREGNNEEKYSTSMVGDRFDTSCYRPEQTTMGISTSVYILNMWRLILFIEETANQ